MAFILHKDYDSPQNFKLNLNKNTIKENISSYKVPILNLSTLKHVKEYAS